jgi:HD-GYP domain-containing protein (c-di-GMP phosphodiesterase class II)
MLLATNRHQLADAWDVMTTSRTYSVAKSTNEALAECCALAGRPFTHDAVEALREITGSPSRPTVEAGAAER